jgi:segregation and condensation protein A
VTPAPYLVSLPAFEGPLDLLLHLIKVHEIDIADIPIARITEEYLRVLMTMRELDLEVAGEFLVMAATLILIKSRLLLPPAAAEADQGEGPPGEADPRHDLVQRLLEYRRFKELGEALGERQRLQRDRYGRGAPLEAVPAAGPLEIPLLELLRALQGVLGRAAEAPAVELDRERLSVGEKMVAILDRLAVDSPLPFTGLFAGMEARAAIVATFLALLELLRQGAVRCRQVERYGEIMLYRAEAAEAAADGGRPG